jgi:EAL domain-containing protein (putative c-di-GMP-specific phosphodiesterase class I)
MLGCEFGQGYFFSSPLNADEAANFFAQLGHLLGKM